MQSPDKIIAAFGKVIRKLRDEKGISQEKLAEFADLERTFISWLETGKKQASITTIFKLSHALRLKPFELMELVEKELSE